MTRSCMRSSDGASPAGGGGAGAANAPAAAEENSKPIESKARRTIVLLSCHIARMGANFTCNRLLRGLRMIGMFLHKKGSLPIPLAAHKTLNSIHHSRWLIAVGLVQMEAVFPPVKAVLPAPLIAASGLGAAGSPELLVETGRTNSPSFAFLPVPEVAEYLFPSPLYRILVSVYVPKTSRKASQISPSVA
jgi:hypothetical protein